MIKILIFLLILSYFSVLKCQNTNFPRVDLSKRYRAPGMNYSMIFCYQQVDMNDAGKVFKIFVERRFHGRPCQILIPSRVFVYFFVNFHFPSIATVVSGNADGGQNLSHVSGIVMPRLHEPTIHGPVYAPCNQSRILYRSLDLKDSLLFSFLVPSEEYVETHPDPDSCDFENQNSQLRKSIGYVRAPWLRVKEPIKCMLEALHEIWLGHSSSLPEYNLTVY